MLEESMRRVINPTPGIDNVVLAVGTQAHADLVSLSMCMLHGRIYALEQGLNKS